MPAFPAIEPINRGYGLGAHPVVVEAFGNSDEVRFLQGDTLSGVPLALDFPALTTNEAATIREHYLGQREHRPFIVPAALWRTHSSQFNVVPAANIWRYAGPPVETPRSGELVDVSVSLVSAYDPDAARIINGGAFTQTPILAPGFAGPAISGGAFTQTPSLAPGAVQGASGGFTGSYAPANWTSAIQGDGSINTSGAPTSISLSSADNGVEPGINQNTNYTITAPAAGTVSFNWSYATADGLGPEYDPFGYLKNGSFTQLTNNLGASSQSGTATFSVASGDTFGFRQNSLDSLGGCATTTITSFTGP